MNHGLMPIIPGFPAPIGVLGRASRATTSVVSTWVAGSSSIVDGTTYTFTGISLGDAVDIVAAISGRSSLTPTISAVTVHTPDIATDPTGSPLSAVVSQVSTGNNIAALYSAARPSGQSTGDIKIVFGSSMVRCRLDLFKKTAHSGSPVTGGSIVNSPTATLAVPANGSVIGCAFTASVTTSTPTNLTEDSDGVLEALNTYTSGHSNSASGSTAFTFTLAGGTNSTGVFAAFGP